MVIGWYYVIINKIRNIVEKVEGIYKYKFVIKISLNLMENLILFNNMNEYTGDGSYARTLFLTKLWWKFYSFKTDPTAPDSLFPGNVVPLIKFDGNRKLKSEFTIKLSRNLNFILANRKMKKIIRTLNKNDESIFVHYLNPSLNPISIDNSIVTIQDLFYIDERGRIKFWDVYAKNTIKNLERYKKIDNIITPSNFTKKVAESNGFDGKITVIPHGVDPSFRPLKSKDFVRRSLGLPDSKKLILSVSTLAKRKNIGMVESVMKRLGDQYALVRVGDAVGSSYTFKNINSDTLNLIYNACDALLFPTLNEGFGIPIIEAFATETPVVTSNLDITNEVSMGSAIICEDDINSYVNGIQFALNNKEEILPLMRKVNEFYSLNSFKDRMKKFYSTLIKN